MNTKLSTGLLSLKPQIPEWFGTGFLPVMPRRLINQRFTALERYV